MLALELFERGHGAHVALRVHLAEGLLVESLGRNDRFFLDLGLAEHVAAGKQHNHYADAHDADDLARKTNVLSDGHNRPHSLNAMP